MKCDESRWALFQRALSLKCSDVYKSSDAKKHSRTNIAFVFTVLGNFVCYSWAFWTLFISWGPMLKPTMTIYFIKPVNFCCLWFWGISWSVPDHLKHFKSVKGLLCVLYGNIRLQENILYSKSSLLSRKYWPEQIWSSPNYSTANKPAPSKFMDCGKHHSWKLAIPMLRICPWVNCHELGVAIKHLNAKSWKGHARQVTVAPVSSSGPHHKYVRFISEGYGENFSKCLALPLGGRGCLLFLVSPAVSGLIVCSLAGARCTPLWLPLVTLLPSFPLLCQQASLSLVPSFILSAHVFLGEAKCSHSSHDPPNSQSITLSPFPLFFFSHSLIFCLFCLHFSPLSACLSFIFPSSPYIPPPSCLSVSLPRPWQWLASHDPHSHLCQVSATHTHTHHNMGNGGVLPHCGSCLSLELWTSVLYIL